MIWERGYSHMNKNILKRVMAVAFAIMMVIAMLPVGFIANVGTTRARAAEGGVVLKVHYHRDDGDYEPWDVWLWPAGKDGAGYAFVDEGGEMVATMEVPGGTTSIGYIVRTQSWEKDINADQFIDISEVVSGTVHAYVESGVEGCTKVYGDDVVTGTKLKTAAYKSANEVLLTFTGFMDEDQKATIYIRGNSGQLEIAQITDNGDFTYTVQLTEQLDLTRGYKVGFAGDEAPVNMPNIYSTEEFEAAYTYTGKDLGAVWSKDKTVFRVWAPTADMVYLNRYESGSSWRSDLIEQTAMNADVNGTWTLTVSGDLNGTYYTYTAEIDGLKYETCDPYARTTGVNGKRAMVIDLDSTDPEGWDQDKNPNSDISVNDAVIYELHIRDFSVNDSSGMTNKGKYIAFTEKGTKTAAGNSTGIDYIKELGVTHVHLLPFYDYGSVDETKNLDGQFNWGYDPVNYNVPEGSYSTDPSLGEVRVREAKQMIKALHDAGLSVVMDVVYNHVQSAADFSVNRLVPGYFSRINSNGSYSNGSGCGNDTASERSMVRKYIVDSVCYWAEEYHIDGFRFDLVGLLDVDTVNEIVSEVHKIRPDIILYGEGWTLSTTVTKDNVKLATQTNSALTPGFAYFNDNIRDGLKGNVFNDRETGYISGAKGKEGAMKASFMASERWSKNPTQIINYASCHDNLTLFDRLQVSKSESSRSDLIRMNNLAAAFYLTAQGIPFMQAGEELLRTKVKADGSFDSNSYSSNDAVNSIKWSDIDNEEYQKVLSYYKGLIRFRKAHPALRLSDTAEVAAKVVPQEGLDSNVLAFEISGDVEGESADKLFVIFNPNETSTDVSLPSGEWSICVNADKAGTSAISKTGDGKITVEPISAMVLVQGDPLADEKENEGPSSDTENNPDANTENANTSDNSQGSDNSGSSAAADTGKDDEGGSAALPIALGVAGAAAVGVGAYAIIRRKKKS